MAKEKKSSSNKPKKKGSFLNKVMMFIIVLSIMVIFRSGFLFLVVGLMPSIVAHYLDITRRRTRFHAVFACNMAGIVPYMAKILENIGNGNSYVTGLMSDSLNWLIIYSAAGFGWFLVYIVPIFARIFISIVNKGQVARIKLIQDGITKDWGDEVANTVNNKNKEI
jgi:hypothetical protein